jgi:hypothetical protein
MLLDQSGQWSSNSSDLLSEANLVLAFGGIDVISKPSVFDELRSRFGNANILLASTAGEIHGSSVLDQCVSVTALCFERTEMKVIHIDVKDYSNSWSCGEAIRKSLLKDDLKHILVISDGNVVNGDELVQGINEGLPENIVVTGGLAGDAGRFNGTLVGLNEIPVSHRIVAVGFYGNNLLVTHGSQGGWDVFGPERVVTKSSGNVLFELDGETALDVYKRYLGPRAAELPGSALLFPLCILDNDGGGELVRTILSIDEAGGSMTFAGNIPSGSRVQFMMANFDRLIDGAADAAALTNTQGDADFVLMVSCIGRKIVLDQRVEEEVEAVCSVFGNKPAYSGFYSNGEISPLIQKVGCSLHNQTMTITAYKEV